MRKSERLKKFEKELQELEQWLKLGLVPKNGMKEHQEEIAVLQNKIEAEKRLLSNTRGLLDADEVVLPKKSMGRAGMEIHAVTDMDTEAGFTDVGLTMETDSFAETSMADSSEDGDEEKGSDDLSHYDDDDDPFSDKNRWRRGILEDPDSGDW